MPHIFQFGSVMEQLIALDSLNGLLFLRAYQEF